MGRGFAFEAEFLLRLNYMGFNGVNNWILPHSFGEQKNAVDKLAVRKASKENTIL